LATDHFQSAAADEWTPPDFSMCHLVPHLTLGIDISIS
jgi:hypothetical protein